MATFRRSIAPYFFTVNTNQRRKVLTNAPFYSALKNVLRQVNAEHPFTIDTFILLGMLETNDAAEDDYGEPQ